MSTPSEEGGSLASEYLVTILIEAAEEAGLVLGDSEEGDTVKAIDKIILALKQAEKEGY